MTDIITFPCAVDEDDYLRVGKAPSGKRLDVRIVHGRRESQVMLRKAEIPRLMRELGRLYMEIDDECV